MMIIKPLTYSCFTSLLIASWLSKFGLQLPLQRSSYVSTYISTNHSIFFCIQCYFHHNFQDEIEVIVPRYRLNSFGHWYFAVVVRWLGIHCLSISVTKSIFRRQLKTYFCVKYWHQDVLSTLDIFEPALHTLTPYLLTYKMLGSNPTPHQL